MDEKALLKIKQSWIFLALLVTFGLFGCTPVEKPPPNQKWLSSQVRALDPAESAPRPFPIIQPSQDLIALYSRETSQRLEIRLDFLELDLAPVFGLHLNLKSDLFIEINFFTEKTENAWDLQIHFPSEGNPEIYANTQAKLTDIPLYQGKDIDLDSFSIALDKKFLPDLRPGYTIRAYLTPPGSHEIIDEIPATHSSTSVEPRPVLLAFWNTYPAYTPVQALKRWDSAHAGPFGERHGLKHLLAAIAKYQIPVFLLDLKSPASLAALELMDETETVVSLQKSGLVFLPETIPHTYFGNLPQDANQRAAMISRNTAINLGYKSSSFLYTPGQPNESIPGYRLLFIQSESQKSAPILTTRKHRATDDDFFYLLLPNTQQIIEENLGHNLSLTSRRALLNSALQPQSKDEIVFIGGDFVSSIFGDPQTTDKTFEYLSGHPWLKTLNGIEIETYPASVESFPKQSPDNPLIQHPATEALFEAPHNSISNLAWQYFLDLSAPVTYLSDNLIELRTTYLGEIGHFLAASQWETSLSESKSQTINQSDVKVTCEQDTDFDGEAEYILANENYFALLDPEGGRLVMLYAFNSEQTAQLIGPSSQFFVGLSDTGDWDLNAGPLADPANIPGGFAGPWVRYQTTISTESIHFSSAGVEKTFFLNETGLQVEIRTENPQAFQLPLVVSPEIRFTPDWPTQYEKDSRGSTWGIHEGIHVQINSSENFDLFSALDSREILQFPENPNQGFLPGHFLPFPLAVAKFPETTELFVEISWSVNQPPDQ